jgi:hypothetical protein
MKRAVLAVALVAASSGVASAGVFVGLGVGPAPAESDSLAASKDAAGRSLRGILGWRMGAFAVEGSYSGYELGSADREAYDVRQAAIAGKYNFGLGDGFSVFPKLGLQHTSLDHGDADADGLPASGSGWLIGVGAEYTFKVATTSASIFVEYQYSSAELDPEVGAPIDFSSRVWTLGATIGF